LSEGVKGTLVFVEVGKVLGFGGIVRGDGWLVEGGGGVGRGGDFEEEV
jgi:hypothetical protein